eukprot:COSAG02_NODE_49066_length_329_cov_0.895652_1_plen_61_part_10
MHARSGLAVLLVFEACARGGVAVKVTIDNTKPRLDVNGKHVNSHDGTIRFIDGDWWLHAAS